VLPFIGSLVVPVDDERQHWITVYVDGNIWEVPVSLLLDRNWIKKILSEIETGFAHTHLDA